MEGNGHSVFSPQADDLVKGKVIGSGSFGIVCLAMNKSTGGLLVVTSARSKVGVQFLESEAKILENLNSPHVVEFMGKNSSNGEFNLILEYMAGGSLSDVAEKFGGNLDEKVIRLYSKEILLGLQYIHNNGIVHCDLKCKNVLLGSNGNVKLADFGCAKRAKSDSDMGNFPSRNSISGTPLWMAPEILRNEKLDFSSDVWSLGCTIIEMKTGRPPWGDKIVNPIAAVWKIAHTEERPPFPAEFSEEGIDFLERCLDRIPSKRWTVEQLLDHPFVSGKSTGTMKEIAFSPASILGFEGEYESDGCDECSCETDLSRIPFLIRKRFLQIESDSDSSEKWVTVRSN